MTSRTPLDLDRWPVHPVGTWEHALVCMVTGHLVPPESAAALADHDRGDRNRPNDRQRDEQRRVTAVRTAASEVVRAAGGVLDLDTLTERLSHDGWDPAEVTRVLLAQFPVTLDQATDDGEHSRGGYRCKWYRDGGRYLAVTSSVALRQYLDPGDQAEKAAEDARKRETRQRAAREREARKREARHPVPEPATVPAVQARRPVLTAEVVNTCRRRAAAGDSVARLAAEYGIHAETMASAVSGATWRGAEVPPVPRTPNRTPEQWAEVTRRALDLMDDGATLTGAARACGVSRRALAEHIRAEGITDGLPWRPGPWTLRQAAG